MRPGAAGRQPPRQHHAGHRGRPQPDHGDQLTLLLLGWAEQHCYTQADGFKGFDFNDDKDGVWFEGTAQMAVAYQMAGKRRWFVSRHIHCLLRGRYENGRGTNLE